MPVVMYPNDTNTQDTLHYYDWVWYLVDGNYVSLNQGGSVGNFANTAGKDDWGHSVFHCPSGLSPDEFPYGQPNSTSKWDPTGSQFTEYEENLRPGVIAPTFLSCWYTLNSADLVGGFGAYPFNAAPHTGTGGGTSPAVDADDRTLQLSFLNPSSQIPLAFDGNNVVVNNNDSGGNYKGPFSGHGANISARHNNYTTCNVVFADGHVEGLTLGQLPGGAPHGGTVPGTIGPNGPGTGNELGNPTALDARNPAVKWMLPPNSYYKNGQP
jgi:prepilin-type processing-associated H-X9-DG protein